MATDLATATPRTRRNLLLAGLGALGAAAAAGATRINPVAAADGDVVRVGSAHSGEATTSFQTDSVAAVMGTSDTAGGVNGTSDAGQGVHGNSQSAAGVRGISDVASGVHGSSTSSRGVWANSESGPGVEANGAVGVIASGGTAGVQTQSSGGYALHSVSGRVRFDGISGVATILAGKTSVILDVSIPVTTATMVLITPQSDPEGRGLWYSRSAEIQRVEILMSSARTKDTKCAFLIIEHANA